MKPHDVDQPPIDVDPEGGRPHEGARDRGSESRSERDAGEAAPAPGRIRGSTIATVSAVTAAAVTATVVQSRAWVTSEVVMPKGPDVLGPWAAAFEIAGASPSIDMHNLPPYSVGMGVVLAPLVRIIEDPRTRYQAAVVLFGLFVLAAGWFTTRWLRRLGFDGSLGQALGYGTTIALTAVATNSTLSWAEPLALVWLAGWVALVGWAVARRSLPVALLVAAFSATGVLVHGRFTLIPAVWVLSSLVIAALDARSGERGLKAGAARSGAVIVVTAGAVLLASAFRSAVVNAAWSDPDLTNDTAILEHLGDPRYWWAIVLESLGQFWYLAASTAGLAVIGIYALARTALARGSARIPRTVAAITLAGLASTFAVSVAFISTGLTTLSPTRLDHLIYGRYSDQVVVLLAGVGVAHLATEVRNRRRRALELVLCVPVLLGAAGVVWLVRRAAGKGDFEVYEPTISGVASWPFDRPGLDVVRWTLIALTALLLLAASRALGRRAFAGVVVLLLILGSIAGTERAVEEHRAWDNSVLYVGYPVAPPGLERAQVALDALGGLSYKFNFPSQQYALANLGWSFEVDERTSDALRRNVPSDAGMVVLLGSAGAPQGRWCHMPPYADLLVWVRSQAFATSGAPGGQCLSAG